MRGSNHPATSAASVAGEQAMTSTVYTQHGAYRTTHAEWTRVERMRTGLLNQMRRAEQLRLTWLGTLRQCGEAHPVTAARREQYIACKAKVDTKTVALRAALERIERECEPVTADVA